MTRDSKDFDALLDRVSDTIREGVPSEDALERVGDRVWARIQQEQDQGREEKTAIRDCSDYQALIPAHVAGALNDAKAMLLEDHVRECVPCRKALKQARSAGRRAVTAAAKPARKSFGSEWSWGIAAALLLAVSLVGFNVGIPGVFTFKTGGMVTIEQLDGELLAVDDNGATPVVLGQQIDMSQVDGIRTAKNSGAVLRMEDGSLVEMRERTELTVEERRNRFGGDRRSSTIDLARGSVIVEAADQGEAALFVRTDDTDVEVKGTVFSVNAGLKGSRVSVFEGEVHVDTRSDDDAVLLPGDQIGSNAHVGRVSLAEEIAWSRNAEKHLAVLAELTKLGKELDASIELPGQRYSTRLLDRAPAGTVVYVAIPNLSEALGEAYDQIESRVNSNPVLREWWTEEMVPNGGDAKLGEAIDRIREYGDHLGEEIVLAIPMSADSRNPGEPVLLAEIERPDAFRDTLFGDLRELAAKNDAQAPNIVMLEGLPPQQADALNPGNEAEFFFWTHNGMLVAGPNQQYLQQMAVQLQTKGGSAFVGSEYHERLSDMYRDGVEWLVGVNLDALIEPDNDNDREFIEQSGFADLSYLIVERETQDDLTTSSATVSFKQERRGIAAWLAEPAPMGSLEFVAPDATLAAAFVMKEPVQVLDELMAMTGDEGVEEGLREFREQHGIDLREDIAAPIGGEFAIALEPPVLPKPSWKLVMEIYDPNRLQNALQTTIGHINEMMGEEGRKGFSLSSENTGGRDIWTLTSDDTGLSASYTFIDGYMVAAPSKILLDRTLSNRRNGLTLTRSPRFTSLLPQDGRINFSAVGYSDLGSMAGPLLRQLQNVGGNGETSSGVIEAIRDSAHSLAYAYGEPDRIVLAGSSEGGLFSSGMSLMSLSSLMDLQDAIGAAAAAESDD